MDEQTGKEETEAASIADYDQTTPPEKPDSAELVATNAKARLRFFEWLPTFFVVAAVLLPGDRILGLTSVFLLTTVAMLLDIFVASKGKLVTAELTKRGSFPYVVLLLLITAGSVVGFWWLLTVMCPKPNASMFAFVFVGGLTWSWIMGAWCNLQRKQWIG